MAVGDGPPAPARSTAVPSLPPPRPKSPPAYPDLYGKRREMAKVQMMEREIGFLKEDLKSAERIDPASRCCREINEFVVSNTDPIIPTNRKKNHSCSCHFFKWLCRIRCFNLSWIFCCCCHDCCSIHLEMPRSQCCDCNCHPCDDCCSCPRCPTCRPRCHPCDDCCSCPRCPTCRPRCPTCPSCGSCFSCRLPKWRCSSCCYFSGCCGSCPRFDCCFGRNSSSCRNCCCEVPSCDFSPCKCKCKFKFNCKCPCFCSSSTCL